MSPPENDQQQLEVFNSIVQLLTPLEEEVQAHVLQSVVSWLKLDATFGSTRGRTTHSGSMGGRQLEGPGSSSEAADDVSPKQFLLDKAPQTNTERVACLAYFLTHYRDMPHFKTLEISRLNTEAAQPKFTNASYSVRDASTSGLLVSAAKGKKQLSAMGEQFVLALPDRDAAKDVLKKMRPKRKTPKKRNSKAKKKTGQ